MKNQKCIFFQISDSKNFRRGLLMFICAFGLILCLQNISLAQSPDSILFKIIKTNFENATGSEKVLFIYESGRVDCGNSTQTPTKKSRLHKTIGCFQISQDKIFQLTELAEQTDFLNAMSSYRFFVGEKNSGSSATIIYYREAANKIILLGTPRTIENQTTPPQSLNQFLQEIQEIDQTMDFEFELGKSLASKR